MKSFNKKGFTLIELLAVIAILAILFMLVTPNILKMFTSGRTQAFVTQVQSIYKAAEAEYMSSQFGTATGPIYCSEATDGTKKLDISENKKLKYYVQIDPMTGKIIKLSVADQNFYYTSTSSDAVSIDNISENVQSLNGKTAGVDCSSGELTGIN